jgi:glycosyltransferase involved in cell wall biosynthesis
LTILRSRNPQQHGRRLLVVLFDPLTPILTKGEILPRYFNPCGVFDEVHFLLLNADLPDSALAQPLVGDAKLHFHNLVPPGMFLLRTAGLTPSLLSRWAEAAVAFARTISPDVVRALNPWIDGYVCAEIRHHLGTPYLLSLHGNPDVDYFRGRLATTWKQRLWGQALDRIEGAAVHGADIVMPVYSPILPYFKRKPARRVELVYNTVGLGLRKKEDYELHRPHARLICVGRQEPDQKDPTAIIRAVAALPQTHLTLVGRGELHNNLMVLARTLGISDRIDFKPALPNKTLMSTLADFDIFVYSSINYEISKGCMEAALCGLPVIVSDRNGTPAQELVDAGFCLVPDTADGFASALRDLISDHVAREMLGRRQRREAESRWSPETTEARQAQLYCELIAQRQEPS